MAPETGVTSSDLRAVGSALHPADAAYLREELEKKRGIIARLRTEGELSRVLVDAAQLDDARNLHALLLDEADPSKGKRESRAVRRKPLTAGALVMMMSMVLASRLGSNAGLGVFLGVLLGAVVFLLLRTQDA